VKYSKLPNPYRNIVFVPLRGDFAVTLGGLDGEIAYFATLEDALACRDRREPHYKESA